MRQGIKVFGGCGDEDGDQRDVQCRVERSGLDGVIREGKNSRVL